MIAFVILCLTSDPSVCERHEVTVEASKLQCLARAQAIVAPYVRRGFAVGRFGCRRAG